LPRFTVALLPLGKPPPVMSPGGHRYRNTNVMKNPFRGKPITKHTPKDVVRALEREVDQITPKAAAHSIDAVQMWALHTANIPQGPHQCNEINIVERVRDH
jgi:hypothetical protein